jgi:hypothetical protein
MAPCRVALASLLAVGVAVVADGQPQKLTVDHGGVKVTMTASARAHGAFVEWADGRGEEDEDMEDTAASAAAQGESAQLSTARRPLQCVGWRGVKGCSPESAGGAFDRSRSLSCQDPVPSGVAGWCECEFAYVVREVGCRHETFTCGDECGRSTAEEVAWPVEAAARQELAPTDTVVAEFLQEPAFSFEFAPPFIMEALNRNLPFAIFLLYVLAPTIVASCHTCVCLHF